MQATADLKQLLDAAQQRTCNMPQLVAERDLARKVISDMQYTCIDSYRDGSSPSWLSSTRFACNVWYELNAF